MRSIGTRIQVWYLLLIVLVVAGMMLALHQARRTQLLSELDVELGRYSSSVIPTLQDIIGASARRGSGESGRPGPGEAGRRGPGEAGRRGPGEAGRPGPGDSDRPRRRHGPGMGMGSGGRGVGPGMSPGPGEDRANNVSYAATAEEAGFYFIVFSDGEEQIGASDGAPAGVDFPGRTRREYRIRGDHREFISLGPRRAIIVMGAPLAKVEEKLASYAWSLAGTGFLIIVGTFVVGWWILRISLRPIDAISKTADEIAEGDLSKRIDVHGSVSELAGLASVLNNSFEKLESAFDQQRRFTADASHEMRTPIAVILAKAQHALRKEREHDDYRQALQACVTSARHMTEVVESLQQLALIDSGKFTIEREPCDLAETATEGIELLTPLAVECGIEIRARLSESECRVDVKRFRQVLINLISNAIKYNREGGSVEVKCRAGEELIFIEVNDTGEGISEEDLPHIFDRFYRADRVRTTRGNSGLGLAITQGIVVAHGGSIDVWSQLGVGTRFSITVPRELGPEVRAKRSLHRDSAAC